MNIRFIALLVVTCPCTIASAAIAPSWWTSGNPPVLKPATAAENLSVANIGQAKWMAKNALEALRDVVPELARKVEKDLVGPDKPIRNWKSPITAEDREDQYSVLTIGQLKAIAAPFYTHLHKAVPGWLKREKKACCFPEELGIFPWKENVPGDGSNMAVATIGQLKSVFVLDFFSEREVFPDGVPDLWESFRFGSLNKVTPDDSAAFLKQKGKKTSPPPSSPGTPPVSPKVNYRYDSMGRLIHGEGVSYRFDEEGNLQSSHK